MAIPATAVWELNQGATASFVNGNGFDPSSTAFITDFTATSATGNAPVISSASYNFVAGDVGAWVYVQSGTNWTPGWYQISSVAANAATVNATIGAAIQVVNGIWMTNTVAGVATTGSPTGGTCGIDYSQGTAANLAATDLVIGADNTTITSVAAPFGKNHAGNCLHITAGTNFTTGWYIISTVTAGVAQLDRACGTAASTAGTGKTGGAGSLNSTLDDAFFEMVVGGNQIWIKYSASSYALGEDISTASTSATGQNPVFCSGFYLLRGDGPDAATRPTIACGAFAILPASWTNFSGLIITGTAAAVFSPGISITRKVKVLNTSTTANRIAFSGVGGGSHAYFCEIISQKGRALTISNSGVIFGCYIHDSVAGVGLNSGGGILVSSVIAGCSSTAVTPTAASNPANMVIGNTLYGSQAKLGTGILFSATVPGVGVFNNIFYGFVTGIDHTTSEYRSNFGNYNNFFNNTTDVTRYTKGTNNFALNPGFIGAFEITGSTATTSGSVLTQSGGDFSSVTDNVDFLRVTSGTGVTTGIYLITSHTATTLTVNNALGTSSAGDVVYTVPTGHNFAIGTNLKAAAYPGPYGTETTSYLDTGAVQRQEPGASFTFVG